MANTPHRMSRHCYSITDVAIASHLIATNRLCSLMHFTTLNHLHITKIQDFDPAGEITLDEKGARRLGEITALVFGPSGKRFAIAFSSSQV